jgi:LytS/YehU family sensor histidine kinase
MLYECNQPMVPLEMELQMLKDYILLEKIRYGNSLDVHVDVPKESDGLLIAPLLLLPFVENCFKHGASHMIDQPWVNLYVSIEDAEMRMKLLNGKPVNYQPINHTHGIGIGNVRKRLELLYPGKFSLDIREEEDVFIVNLRLELEKRKVVRDLKPKVLVATDA